MATLTSLVGYRGTQLNKNMEKRLVWKGDVPLKPTEARAIESITHTDCQRADLINLKRTGQKEKGTPLTPALRRQKQGDPCESEASLFYIVSSKTTRVSKSTNKDKRTKRLVCYRKCREILGTEGPSSCQEAFFDVRVAFLTLYQVCACIFLLF